MSIQNPTLSSASTDSTNRTRPAGIPITSFYLPRLTFGVGDRFGCEGAAQLKAFQDLTQQGVFVHPVWNKSEREHTTIGTEVSSVRSEADTAIQECAWNKPYFVDADHIKGEIVDKYLPHSDFFTLDVADDLGIHTNEEDAAKYLSSINLQAGAIRLDENHELNLSEEQLMDIAKRFIPAIRKVSELYQRIKSFKKEAPFITEVSMDEVDSPQTPEELLFILAALSHEGVPADTIAPRFPGRFNKGVEYVGDVSVFEKSFEAMVKVISYASFAYSLPAHLKLSIHSGSDKFAIYPVIRSVIRRNNTGIHIKTAGTTWLEECIGLGEAGENEWLQSVYTRALDRWDELCTPYASVIDIDRSKLPSLEASSSYSGGQWARILRHEQSCNEYNLNMRQLFHVSYKIAAEDGEGFKNLLLKHRSCIEKNVHENIYSRHLLPLFGPTSLG
ncbi:MAG: hypothetical protein HQL32_07875 [Planctomycetes bacterium]|nr:hypothetical protein [Planctomycetota bacterium]